MADKPILFSGPMVRALLAGTKTQTRRVPKILTQSYVANDNRQSNKPGLLSGMRYWNVSGAVGGRIMLEPDFLRLLPNRVGDRLYVREAWSGTHAFRNTPPAQRESMMTPDGPLLREDVWFWADGNPDGGDYEKARPGMHMPRWASRLTLTVTDVRVERLQDISETDAQAEGITRIGAEYIARGSKEWESGPNFYQVDIGGGSMNDATAVSVYMRLWDWINGEGSADANPWVAAYTFTVERGNIDQIGGA